MRLFIFACWTCFAAGIECAQESVYQPLRLEPFEFNFTDVDHNHCSWKFHAYKRSTWEHEWMQYAKLHPFEISALLLTVSQQQRALKFIKTNWVLLTSELSDSELNSIVFSDIYSSMVYGYYCGDILYAFGEHLIEPLMGFLRDPLFMVRGGAMPVFDFMDGSDGSQSKRFILPAGNAPFRVARNVHVQGWHWDKWQHLRSPPWYRNSSRYIFDLGSSYFTGWDAGGRCAGDALGASWLLKHAPPVSRIFAFEYSQLDHARLWDQIPEELFHVYTPINHGVSGERKSKYNPLRLITNTVKRGDYVILKLDIDTPSIELLLVEQLTEGFLGVNELVSEFFFEHHVSLPELDAAWGLKDSPQTIADSYMHFSRLRRAGIRAHSWP